MSSHYRTVGVLAVLCFALYANTLTHEFVLDDKIVITENQFTKKGFEGIGELWRHDSMTGFFGRDKSLVAGGRYRPLSMTTHAIEWEIFGDAPLGYHLINILFYIGNVLLLFFVLLHCFPLATGKPVWWSVAFVGTALFALHPLHTEVVANIKSRDELMSIFFALCAVLILLQSQKCWQLAGVGGLFFLSLLSKESSVVFVGIIPLLFYYFKGDSAPTALRKSLIPFIAVLIYMLVRWTVLGSAKIEIADEWMNNPFLYTDTPGRLATIVYTLLRYLFLGVWPHPLTHDYYPAHIPIMSWSDVEVLAGLFVYLGLLGYALFSLRNRQKAGMIIWVHLAGIVLYSNLLFPIGTFMNERFMYVSTMGIAVGAAWVVIWLRQRNVLAGMVFLILGVGLMAFKTVERNSDWESDITLAIKDVEVSANSAKCNMSAGGGYVERALALDDPAKRKRELGLAVKHLKRALEIYPTYMPALLLSGNAHTALQNYDKGIFYYEKCLQRNPSYNHALTNLEYIAQEASREKKFDIVARAYQTLLRFQPGNALYNERLGETLGRDLGKPKEGLAYLQKAHALYKQSNGASSPNAAQKEGMAELCLKLGVANAMIGALPEAKKHLKEGLQYNAQHARLWFNLGILFQNTGKIDSAEMCLQKAFELEPDLRGPQ
ncbi:MAG: hypothetical protein KDC37_01455 [Flavobacteriales bacterium]|nr:hypothetical protein [Flavobacteriales bacterium]